MIVENLFDGGKRRLSLEECKKRLLTILVDFDIFCKNNNLKYFLMWGSLIGAIRYDEFIPWDDDIDVAMPRIHYNRMIKLSKELEIPYNFFVM